MEEEKPKKKGRVVDLKVENVSVTMPDLLMRFKPKFKPKEANDQHEEKPEDAVSPTD